MDLPISWKCLLFLGLVFHFSNGLLKVPNDCLRSSPSSHFDKIIFTQLWPKTFCLDLKQTSNLDECNIPEKEMWTIHGIWPSKYHTFKPDFCDRSLTFDPSLLTNIRDELEKNWISVESKAQPEEFWKHEWDKHGTCSACIKSVSTQIQYFEKGLELFKKYNADELLERANIFPGQQYSVYTILKRMNRILGARIYVDCVKNKETNEQYFHEVRICFDKSFNLTDCDGIANFPSNCNFSEAIIYPKN